MKSYENKICAAMAGDAKFVELWLISKSTIESSGVKAEMIKMRI
jgi:hypothetical protein